MKLLINEEYTSSVCAPKDWMFTNFYKRFYDELEKTRKKYSIQATIIYHDNVFTVKLEPQKIVLSEKDMNTLFDSFILPIFDNVKLRPVCLGADCEFAVEMVAG